MYMFLGSAILLAVSIFMFDWKRSCSGHLNFINFNKSLLFSVKCLKTWHIRFFGICESMGPYPFSWAPENEAVAAILISAILINHSYFRLHALKPGIYIYIFGVCESIDIVRFHVWPKTRPWRPCSIKIPWHIVYRYAVCIKYIRVLGFERELA